MARSSSSAVVEVKLAMRISPTSGLDHVGDADALDRDVVALDGDVERLGQGRPLDRDRDLGSLVALEQPDGVLHGHVDGRLALDLGDDVAGHQARRGRPACRRSGAMMVSGLSGSALGDLDSQPAELARAARRASREKFSRLR